MVTQCEADIWRPRTECDNLFDGPDPNLLNIDAAILVGTSDATNTPHLAAGPTLTQAKANATTAAKQLINTLGGDVDIGGPLSLVQAWNLAATALERVLTLSDRFYAINPTPMSATSYVVKPSDIGFKTNVTNPAGVTFTLDDSSAAGVTVGQESIFYVSGAVGIVGVAVGGVQSLIAPAATAVGIGRTVSFTYVASNTWLYTGP